MNKTKNFLSVAVITILSFFVSPQSGAHEGHAHDAPKGVSAPRGGQIKEIENTYVEVVTKKNELKIYLYDKELKPLDAATYKVSATAQKPRAKKQEDILLSVKENFFEATYDAKGAHRYSLTLLIKDPKEAHQDKLKFNIEPKK